MNNNSNFSLPLRQLNEAKVLIVGQPEVGKTSLVNRLIDNKFDANEAMIEGINVKRWPFKLADDREISLNIWDFGGQEIMHATHQFFLTKRSLYIILIDAREGENKGKLEYWLKTAQKFGDNAPVLVVVNKIDIHPLQLNQRALQDKYPMIKGFLEISCKDAKGIDQLKDVIREQLTQLKHVNEELPEAWFNVKGCLEEKNADYYFYEDFEKLCKEKGVRKESRETLIELLHDLGTVICFQENLHLQGFYFINPNWLTTGVYKIIMDRDLIETQGMLNTYELRRILPRDRYPLDTHRFIVEIMRKFEFCFEFYDERNTFLIPELLPKDAPPEIEFRQEGLLFNYQYDLLPSSIISRFIVGMKAYLQEGLYWRYGVKLTSLNQENQALVWADLDQKKICIMVTGKAPGREYFLEAIRVKLQGINKSIPNLQITELIPLPGYDGKEVEYQWLVALQRKAHETCIAAGVLEEISLDKLLAGIKELSPKYSNKSIQVDSLAHKNLKQLTKALNPSAPIKILHLPGIGLSNKQEARIYRQQLILDLRERFKLEQVDYLVISGNLANNATPEEYEVVSDMLDDLTFELKLPSNRIIIAPGNHDLNWDASEDAYEQFISSRKLPASLDETYIAMPDGALKRDEAKYRKRFTNFATFYRRICNQAYPLTYEDQGKIHVFPEHKLVFLTLNSAWQIDHRYQNRASINNQVVKKAVVRISNRYEDYYKIAVWHHPVSGPETMQDTAFLELLARKGFEVCLHGHINQAKERSYEYDFKRKLHIIGGGTLGAPAREQITYSPVRYNLLEFDLKKGTIDVYTGKEERSDFVTIGTSQFIVKRH
jgi:small GTP-binding protein